MHIFIAGITGGVGRRVAERLVKAGHAVSGLVRKAGQAEALQAQGITAVKGDLVGDSTQSLAEAMKGCDVVLFTAGAGETTGPEVTTATDGDGPGKLARAAIKAGIHRFYLVSAFPEAWRERDTDDDFEHYMVEKKRAEIELSGIDIDWVILRPSELTNEPGSGTVDIGAARLHTKISRDDVAGTLVALMETPKIRRVILEATGGGTTITTAVTTLATPSPH